jgi:hypothetical protein
MATEALDKFKKVESSEELAGLVGELIQLHNPGPDDYFMGILKSVEESKRMVGDEEKTDIVIYLKDGLRKKGKIIDIDSYESNPNKHPTIYIPRVITKGIGYVLMHEPSE